MVTPSPLGYPPPGPTCQRVDKAAGQQGQHRDQGPVGEALILHAAVDRDRGLVTLEDRTRSSDPPGMTTEVLHPKSGECLSVHQHHRPRSGHSTSGVLDSSQKD